MARPLADLTSEPATFEGASAVRPPVARAKVIRAPAGTTDTLDVALQNFSMTSEYTVEPERWTLPGAGVPALGDTCVVVFDDDGDIWVVRWSRRYLT